MQIRKGDILIYIDVYSKDYKRTFIVKEIGVI